MEDGGVREEEEKKKKMIRKQLTCKRDDSALHSAARAGNLELVLEIMGGSEDVELRGLLGKQNQSGETALYVASEFGYVDLVKEMIKFYDVSLAGIKATNGFDAFHIAAKQGELEVLNVLMDADPQLSLTFDSSNTTALHSAVSQGHLQVVDYLLEKDENLVSIPKSNGKTVLHSAARHGHLEILKTLLGKEIGLATRIDKKGQTALHMAVKGQNTHLVHHLITSHHSLINMVDAKGNTALHIATRKGRTQIIKKLLDHNGIDKVAINKSGETAFDTAEKTGRSETASMLKEYGVVSAKSIKQPTRNARELKQTVSDIKHEVHDQLENTRRTRKGVKGIAKGVKKMHEGLNNAINSTTVVAVLIATVAFAAIFSLPGQYPNNPEARPPGFSLGEAYIASKPEFMIFVIFDSIALFISLAVVVVQTSVIIIERKAKKQMMAVINKLMWLACVMISVAFLALSYIVVGYEERWLAVCITGVGTVIMVSTIGTMCYWVVVNRIEASKKRTIRRSSMSTSRSLSITVLSDPEYFSDENQNKLYAV